MFKGSIDSGLVVTRARPNDPYAIPLNQWQRGERNLELVRHGYGQDLLEILTQELGLITINEAGLLQSKIFIPLDDDERKRAAMRLLGKIAEALLVRNCNASVHMNRKWGQVARRGIRQTATLDDYKAIGTGLESTKRTYHQKYRPNDSQRDVIWIHKQDAVRELQMLASGRPAGISAGLQLKVSLNGFRYIYRSDILANRYEVPLVYFDLRNDFHELANAIHKDVPFIEVGRDIVRGKDIDPACHDELESYRWLVESLFDGRLSVDELARHTELADAYKKQVLEEAGALVITI